MRGLTWLCGLAQGFHAPAERQVLETLQRFGFICAALCRLRRKKVKKRPFNLWFSFVEFWKHYCSISRSWKKCKDEKWIMLVTRHPIMISSSWMSFLKSSFHKFYLVSCSKQNVLEHFLARRSWIQSKSSGPCVTHFHSEKAQTIILVLIEDKLCIWRLMNRGRRLRNQRMDG